MMWAWLVLSTLILVASMGWKGVEGFLVGVAVVSALAVPSHYLDTWFFGPDLCERNGRPSAEQVAVGETCSPEQLAAHQE